MRGCERRVVQTPVLSLLVPLVYLETMNERLSEEGSPDPSTVGHC